MTTTDNATRGSIAVRFTAAITHEGEWYVARCLEVEVASQGTSIEDSLANLKEALELYLEEEHVEAFQPPIIAQLDVA